MPAHVLVVDDSALVTSALRMLLESSGYRVSDAGTLNGAVALASADPVDVMLLDLALPDGNGLDALKLLADRGSLPRVTLAMTGDDDDRTRARCLAAGCGDVLVKPVSINDLRAAISTQLGRAAAAGV